MKKSVYLSSLLAFCCSLFAISARAQAPVVTANPVPATTCQADTAWFTVAATSGTAMTFQWEYSTDGGMSWDTTADGAVYLGTFNDTLRVIPTSSMSGTWYRALVFNTSGSDTSDAAMLTVEVPVSTIAGPSIVCKGSTIGLTNPVAGGIWSSGSAAASVGSSSGVVTGVDFGTAEIYYALTNTCGTSFDTAMLRVDTNMVNYLITGPTHVCVGNSITLMNMNTIGTTMWSTGVSGHAMVSSTGVVTGVGGGLDTVTYTITNACNSQTSSRIVNVETLPAAGTIMGATAVCAGSWTTLTATAAPAGIWLSGTTSVAVVSGAGNVTGIAQGTSVISYYQSNSCGASFATHTIMVEIPAAPLVGNDSVGIDSTIILTNIVPGGFWTSMDPAIASVIVGGGGGAVTGHDTGITTIMYTVMNTCGSSSSSIAMNVGPLPNPGTLSGPDSVCVGATVTFTPTVAGGTWDARRDTIASADATTGVITGVKYGMDTVDYYVTTAFGRSRVFKRIFVNEPPIIYVAGPGSVSLGGSYALSAFPAAGNWTSNNPAMAPITAQSSFSDSGKLKASGFFVVIDTGTTVFTYTRSNTCGTRTRTFTIHLPGVTEVKSVGNGVANLSIFPNPTQGALSVNITSAETEEVVMTLTNVTGQVVQEIKVKTNTPTNVVIDQPAGMYILNAVTKDGNRHSARISVTN